MNDVAQIERTTASGRSFRLPLEMYQGQLVEAEMPRVEVNWSALPDCYLDGIDFASRFLGTGKGRSKSYGHVELVHVDGSKIYGGDNLTLVEYVIGGNFPYHAHTSKDVRILKGLGSPTHLSLDTPQEKAPDSGEINRFEHFKSANGNRLSRLSPDLYFESYPKQFDALFDGHDWSEMSEITDDWRAQVVGAFSSKPISGNDGLLHFTSDSIVGGIFDNRPDIELRIETFAKGAACFEQSQFLRMIKVAQKIKFVHSQDQVRVLFTFENGRGIVAGRIQSQVPS